MKDKEIRKELRKIDDDDATDVTKFEAEFIDSVVYQYTGPLTPKQQNVAIRIIEKYGRR